MAYHTRLWRSPIRRGWRSCAISPICWDAHSRRNSCFQCSAMRTAQQTFDTWANYGDIGCHRKPCIRSRKVRADSTSTFGIYFKDVSLLSILKIWLFSRLTFLIITQCYEKNIFFCCPQYLSKFSWFKVFKYEFTDENIKYALDFIIIAVTKYWSIIGFCDALSRIQITSDLHSRAIYRKFVKNSVSKWFASPQKQWCHEILRYHYNPSVKLKGRVTHLCQSYFFKMNSEFNTRSI